MGDSSHQSVGEDVAGELGETTDEFSVGQGGVAGGHKDSCSVLIAAWAFLAPDTGAITVSRG